MFFVVLTYSTTAVPAATAVLALRCHSLLRSTQTPWLYKCTRLIVMHFSLSCPHHSRDLIVDFVLVQCCLVMCVLSCTSVTEYGPIIWTLVSYFSLRICLPIIRLHSRLSVRSMLSTLSHIIQGLLFHLLCDSSYCLRSAMSVRRLFSHSTVRLLLFSAGLSWVALRWGLGTCRHRQSCSLLTVFVDREHTSSWVCWMILSTAVIRIQTRSVLVFYL